jgi:CubicO group peptidase (beta-lactamase class C family)
MKNATVLLCLVVVWAPAMATAPPDATTLEERVDAYLRPLVENDLISGSVLIARDGKIEVAKGYGPANREHDVPCTAETRYRLASMTKSFTAMGIMILQERDLLNVQDNLDKYLPDFPAGDRITLHHLLTHTSGVINYSALPDHYRVWAMPHTVDEVIARFSDEPLRFEPGERFEYSNSGYVLLTRVIEKVGGVDYETFLRENIFVPLGMTHTGIDSHTAVIPQRATGHYNFGDGIVQAQYLNVGFTSGAGGLLSTVGDLYRWDRALYTEELVARATLEKIFTPYARGYGYGWFVREEFGRTLIEHRGGLNGFLSMIQRFVDDDVTVITLFNYVSTFGRDANRGLAAIALGETPGPILIPEGVEISEETLRAMVGRYRLGESVLEMVADDGRPWVVDDDRERSRTVPQSATRLWLPDDNAVLDFVAGQDGRIERLLVRQGERVIPCPRLEAEPVAEVESPPG